jgi:uncharacterized protein with PIN domain
METVRNLVLLYRQLSKRKSLSKALWMLTISAGLLVILTVSTLAQENSDCLMCHSDTALTKKRAGRAISLHVDENKFKTSIHGKLTCIACHADLKGKEMPHDENLAKPQCGTCHSAEQALYQECKHGKASGRNDPLAPTCKDCHGSHDILAVKNPKSTVAPMNVPYLCGRCHREGAPVAIQRQLSQEHILENYSESIHGDGLFKRGLTVSATCASCHSPHRILPHTDPRSTIARANIAATCTQCHALIEQVHRKVIKGELWEKEKDVLPACVDCHQPHKVRKVFYDQGMADRDCLRCHSNENLKASNDGRSLFVNTTHLAQSRHVKTACSQCHSGVNPSKLRPCETLAQKKVDCTTCHAEVAENYQQGVHGQLFAKNDPNAPTCLECHGTHSIRGKREPASPTFPTNVPDLCARCHREGSKAAVRYVGGQHQIIDRYRESIHGKGLLRSGLVVTAMCTDCHTSHRELPSQDPQSSVQRDNVAATCGRCHHGIEDQFNNSIHSTKVSQSKKALPVCSDCHSAHTIRRTDQEGFKLHIMEQCGQCHQEIAKTYFDTYHGKVSQLGYTKTAKCYDCHGAHDILPISSPKSHLGRDNVVETCKKCHAGATRRFAGYLTHATHHDPAKYPWLYWTFWGMTTLLLGTFAVSGLHTLLWLPQAFKMRQERKKQRIQRNMSTPADQQ